MSALTFPDFLVAGSHYGHPTYRCNPKMFPYIYAEQNGVHIIDLVQTSQLLKKACSFASSAASEGKTFLFVGTKRQAAPVIAQEAEKCGAYFVNHRWLGGLLTNWSTIRKRVDRLEELEEQEASGLFEKLPKKEVAVLRRELKNLQKNLGGMKGMTRIPDVVIAVDQRCENIALQECKKLNIPTICVVDTNNDPDDVTIPIPANDDSIASIVLLINKLGSAILEGKQKAKA